MTARYTFLLLPVAFGVHPNHRCTFTGPLRVNGTGSGWQHATSVSNEEWDFKRAQNRIIKKSCLKASAVMFGCAITGVDHKQSLLIFLSLCLCLFRWDPSVTVDHSWKTESTTGVLFLKHRHFASAKFQYIFLQEGFHFFAFLFCVLL